MISMEDYILILIICNSWYQPHNQLITNVLFQKPHWGSFFSWACGYRDSWAMDIERKQDSALEWPSWQVGGSGLVTPASTQPTFRTSKAESEKGPISTRGEMHFNSFNKPIHTYFNGIMSSYAWASNWIYIHYASSNIWTAWYHMTCRKSQRSSKMVWMDLWIYTYISVSRRIYNWINMYVLWWWHHYVIQG